MTGTYYRYALCLCEPALAGGFRGEGQRLKVGPFVQVDSGVTFKPLPRRRQWWRLHWLDWFTIIMALTVVCLAVGLGVGMLLRTMGGG